VKQSSAHGGSSFLFLWVLTPRPSIQAHPSIFWLPSVGGGAGALRGAALVGLALAAWVAATGGASKLVMAALWALYMSIANVGQAWSVAGVVASVFEAKTGQFRLLLRQGTLCCMPRHLLAR